MVIQLVLGELFLGINQNNLLLIQYVISVAIEKLLRLFNEIIVLVAWQVYSLLDLICLWGLTSWFE
jgi:hypothetical protein